MVYADDLFNVTSPNLLKMKLKAEATPVLALRKRIIGKTDTRLSGGRAILLHSLHPTIHGRSVNSGENNGKAQAGAFD